jgi:peptidoglycan/LPS O-acetylase OafA/YrhL
MNEIKSLTGIRGCAAFYVVLYHFVGVGFLKNGYLSVDMFFILSGFIMCLVYENSFVSKVRKDDYINFIWHRICRIYPIYIFLTFFYIAYLLMSGGVLSLSQFITNVFILQSEGISEPYIGPSWSLSVEFIMYFSFPLIFILIKRHDYLQIALLMLSFSASIYISTHHTKLVTGNIRFPPHGALDLWSYNSLGAVIRGISGFSIGMCAYFIYKKINKINIILINYLQILISISIFVSLVLGGLDLVFVLLSAILILLLAMHDNGFIGILLGSKYIHYLGKISLSLYLVHALILKITHDVILTLNFNRRIKYT